jgi:DNA (cytosine-5)-methyltransferase 1
MNAVSLFANIGVAEAYLEEIGISVVVANEIAQRRADLYSQIYPETEMITGDINSEEVLESIIKECDLRNVEVVIATPPCQGMSTAGQKKKDDVRNLLILPVIKLIQRIKPKYIFLENVPNLLNTTIVYGCEEVLIRELLMRELSDQYHIQINTIDTKDYSVPQTRERAIILMTKKSEVHIWELPEKSSKVVTLEEAIGDLPMVDPFVKDVSEKELLDLFPLFYERKKEALSISRWNNPPHHIRRQVEVMMHTPTGRSAFDNEYFIPRKEDGTPVRGYKNTYKRQNWDRPAYTVTMDNRKISSQNNVHPGRYIGIGKSGVNVYSDPRALTVYELMIVSTLPKDWSIPSSTQEAFLRSIIGEGIPPLFVKKTFERILR